MSLTKNSFSKITRNESFENNQEITPPRQNRPVRDVSGENSPQRNASMLPVTHENLSPQTNIPEQAEIFNHQPTKRPSTAAIEPPPPRITAEDFVASSHIQKLFTVKGLTEAYKRVYLSLLKQCSVCLSTQQ